MLGASAEPYPAVAVTDEDRAAADVVLAGRPGPYAVLHAGATDARRRWPPERFAAVADHLTSRGLTVLLTGTLAERELTAGVAARAASDVVDLAGRLSLAALAGVLDRCDVVMSNDTGPMHLADAVGTPTVGIFWCGNVINAGPLRRSRHRPLLSWTIHCPECGANSTRDIYPSRTGGDACRHRPSFVADVPVVEVIDAAEDLLDQHSARRHEVEVGASPSAS
jgi:ADP-heptose:LPS heptosyltransferase